MLGEQVAVRVHFQPTFEDGGVRFVADSDKNTVKTKLAGLLRFGAAQAHAFYHPLRGEDFLDDERSEDRKSTRLNSSHGYISYAVFCLKKKKNYCGYYHSPQRFADYRSPDTFHAVKPTSTLLLIADAHVRPHACCAHLIRRNLTPRDHT